ncbi:MAG: hydantoinase B/oxoprolinase family protein, partial [Dehalococcoidia bacterium]
MTCPIFYQGRLIFCPVTRAHRSDVGGPTYGGYNPAASELYQEGLRLPPLKLYDKGSPRRDQPWLTSPVVVSVTSLVEQRSPPGGTRCRTPGSG